MFFSEGRGENVQDLAIEEKCANFGGVFFAKSINFLKN